MIEKGSMRMINWVGRDGEEGGVCVIRGGYNNKEVVTSKRDEKVACQANEQIK